MHIPKVVQGDVGTRLRFNITDQNRAIVNLTGATVTLYIQRPDVTLTRSCSVIGAASGLAEYTTIAGDLSVGNCIYYLKVNVQLPTGQFTAIDKFPISVLPK